MFKESASNHLLSPGLWLLLLTALLLVGPLYTPSRTFPQAAAAEMSHSAIEAQTGAVAVAALEQENPSGDVLAPVNDLSLRQVAEATAAHPQQWQHFWATSPCFAHLTRPPPALS